MPALSRSGTRSGTESPFRWGKRATAALADQALFALANFTLNVILARSLPPHQYGAFAVCFSVLLLLGNVHQAIIIEPMMVFGAGRFADRLPGALRAIVGIHVRASVLGTLLLLAAAIVTWTLDAQATLVTTLAAAGLAAPFILLLWLARRATYVAGRVHLAVASGAGYFFLIAGGAVGLHWLNALSAASSFALMAAASSVAGGSILSPLLKGPSHHVSFKELLPLVYGYGRWSLASSLLAWIPTNLLLLALPIIATLSEAAAYRAAFNVVMPVLLAASALTTLLLPSFTKRIRAGDYRPLLRATLAIFGCSSAAYSVLLAVAGPRILTVLYGGEYTFDRLFLALFGLLLLPETAWMILATLFRAAEKPNYVFWSALLAAASTLIVGVPLTVFQGIYGTIIAAILAALIQLTTLLLFLNKEPLAIVSVRRPPS